MRLPFTGDDGSPQLGNFVKETSTHKNVRSLWKKDCESPSNLLQKTSFRTSSWTTWSSSVGFCLYRRLFLTNSKVLSCITLRRSSTFSFEHCSLEHRRSREHRKNRMTPLFHESCVTEAKKSSMMMTWEGEQQGFKYLSEGSCQEYTNSSCWTRQASRGSRRRKVIGLFLVLLLLQHIRNWLLVEVRKQQRKWKKKGHLIDYETLNRLYMLFNMKEGWEHTNQRDEEKGRSSQCERWMIIDHNVRVLTVLTADPFVLM